MKARIMIIRPIALCGMIVLIFTSCGKDNQKRIVGKWEISSCKIVCSQPEEHKTNLANAENNLSGYEMLRRDENTLVNEGTTYEFYDTGLYLANEKSTGTHNGNYAIKGDSLILRTTNGDLDLKAKIIFLSDTKIEIATTQLKIGGRLDHVENRIGYYDKVKKLNGL